MKSAYTIDEILDAVDELQKNNKKKIKKEKKIVSVKNTPKTDNSIIPKDTLKLIEEAEKNKS